MEHFNCLGSMTTKDARCTHEVEPKIATPKTALNKEKAILTSKLDVNLREKRVKCYIWEQSFVWCWRKVNPLKTKRRQLYLTFRRRFFF